MRDNLGRLWMTVTLASIAACAGTDVVATNDLVDDGLRYSVSLDGRANAADVLVARLKVVNTTSATRDVTYSDCASFATVALRVYSAQGRRLWDSDQAARNEFCLANLTMRRIAPGDSTEFVRSFNAYQIVSDSVPAAKYELRMPLRYGQPRLPAELVLGTIQLARD